MVGIIAGKYARALFELAVEANAADDYMDAAVELLPLLNEEGEFFKVITNPAVVGDDKIALFKEVAAKCVAKLPEDFVALFALLTRKGRDAEVTGVFEGFIALAREHKRLTTARVYSAKPLDAARLDEIKAKLEKRLDKTVEIEPVIDESLIAGVKISVDGHEIDGTVKRGIDGVKAAIYAS